MDLSLPVNVWYGLPVQDLIRKSMSMDSHSTDASERFSHPIAFSGRCHSREGLDRWITVFTKETLQQNRVASSSETIRRVSPEWALSGHLVDEIRMIFQTTGLHHRQRGIKLIQGWQDIVGIFRRVELDRLLGCPLCVRICEEIDRNDAQPRPICCLTSGTDGTADDDQS